MATMVDKEPTGLQGEIVTYRVFAKELPDDYVVYHNRESANGHEFDFCILIPDKAFIIVEVKGWHPNGIKVITPDSIQIEGLGEVRSPEKQARIYRFELQGLIKKKLCADFPVGSMVCYPFLSSDDYHRLRLDIVSNENLTLFSEDLNDRRRLLKKISNCLQPYQARAHDPLEVGELRSLFERRESKNGERPAPYSETFVASKPITNEEAQKLLDEYLLGAKIFLFVPDDNSLSKIAGFLHDRLYEKHVVPNGSGLKLSSEDFELGPKNGVLSIFAFEGYSYDPSDVRVERPFTILDGRLDDDSKTILELFGKKTRFNYEQYLVEHALADKNILVKAGAGTGKTYSMVSRIAFLCSAASNSGLDKISEKLAMLTFTREAAANMKSRLKDRFYNYFLLTGTKRYLDLSCDVERTAISTIHSFAQDVMSEVPLRLGLGSDFVTASGVYDRRKFMQRCLNEAVSKRLGSSILPKMLSKVQMREMINTLCGLAEQIYNQGFDVLKLDFADLGPFSPDRELNELAILLLRDVMQAGEYNYYQSLIKKNLYHLNRYILGLRECIEDDSFNQSTFPIKYLFIDEFQDVDDGQIDVFRTMWKKLGFHFFIVGDIKQSIYRFRGATLDAFSKMSRSTGDWLTYSLRKNYRSDARLLRAFDPIFAKMGSLSLLPYTCDDVIEGVKEGQNADYKPFVSFQTQLESDHGDKNVKKEHEDLFLKNMIMDAQKRAKEIESSERFGSLSKAERTIAFICPKNKEVSDIAKLAKQIGINIETERSIRLYALPPAIDLCKLTAVLSRPHDPVYLFDFLTSNFMSCSFNASALYGKTEQEKEQILVRALDYSLSIRMNCHWADIIRRSQNEPILKLIRDIYLYCKPWVAMKSETAMAEYQMNFDLLFEDFTGDDFNDRLTLERLYDMVSVRVKAGSDRAGRNIDSSNEKKVGIVGLTIHKAKGLEFDSVYLPVVDFRIGGDFHQVEAANGKLCLNFSLDKKASWSFSNMDDEEKTGIESKKETNRLIYVALTRAINHVVVNTGRYSPNSPEEWAEFFVSHEAQGDKTKKGDDTVENGGGTTSEDR